MNYLKGIWLFLLLACFGSTAYLPSDYQYLSLYKDSLNKLKLDLEALDSQLEDSSHLWDLSEKKLIGKIKETRLNLKKVDFWLRYIDPLQYKLIHGPLTIEWETEVFEKYEKPYLRKGAGLLLMEECLNSSSFSVDSLKKLLSPALEAINIFLNDSLTRQLQKPDHFFFANRLFLLNSASIYTSGFENPDSSHIIHELKVLFRNQMQINLAFESQFPLVKLNENYKVLFLHTTKFIENFNGSYSDWNQFSFIKDYINPLFRMNQQMIQGYNLKSYNINDYSLSDTASSIFSKFLFRAQPALGVYDDVNNQDIKQKIRDVGKLLFYDPILSVNNKRACASCHKADHYFTDTSRATALHLDRTTNLSRNILDLLNVQHYQLLMLDGAHISLLGQAHHVIQNPEELGETEKGLLQKIKSIPHYNKAFTSFAKYTSDQKYNLNHVASAIILYYTEFNKHQAKFDLAMNNMTELNAEEISGFNLFMGKAQCGTCHFPPLFSGSKPPYTNAEFEVIGTPQDSQFLSLSPDKGRYLVYPYNENLHAFRTPTLKNISRTKPYMHNGVFSNLNQVLIFYNHGGGLGNKLNIPNQTLPADSLHLSFHEINNIISFLQTLDEDIEPIEIPSQLPNSKNPLINKRKPGGEY